MNEHDGRTDFQRLAAALTRVKGIQPPCIQLVYRTDDHTPAGCKAAVEDFIRIAEGTITKSESTYSENDIRLTTHFGKMEVRLDIPKKMLGCKRVTVTKQVEEWQCGPLLEAIREEVKA